MDNRTINNERFTPRVFENDFAEKLSHVHPASPIVVFIPASLVLLYRAVGFGQGVATVVGLFLIGLFFWTLAEYLLHRYLFHFNFKSEIGAKVHFMIHGIHHDFPRDPKRLVIPLTLSIPLAIGVYLLFVLTLGEVTAQASFAGFLFGYVSYDTIHFATHHFAMKNSRIGQIVKRHHLRHHYQNEDMAFGVSSPLWDIVFGTAADPEEKAKIPKSAPKKSAV